ncbi:putative R3H and G-patch domain protein [Aspergillus bombycis]|uniref:Protein SQS1 n=1 Tax=Aspergillus bombycis TaxID=109264 RepID=A0A1F7ZL48_9EURO|nr:putative R3H and G-patch domain protein [Aspergillus bombycis]OGM39765.1 putative R3H and G-patch domain protein [Aspergillus bombycis]
MARHSKAKARIKRQKPTTKSNIDHQLGHLTMQQEARNTEGRNLWRTGSNLRHQGVRFVSAGNTQRDENNEGEAREGDGPWTEENNKQPPTRGTESKEDAQDLKNEPAMRNAPFFIDLSGEIGAHTGLADPITALSLSESDNSSEDEVVFYGRRRLEERPRIIVEDHAVKAAKTSYHSSKDLESPPEARLPAPDSKVCLVSDGISTYELPQRSPPTAENIGQTKTVMPYGEKIAQETSENENDDILADYIANMAEHYYADLHNSLAGAIKHEPEHGIEMLPQNFAAHAATSDSIRHSGKGKYLRRDILSERKRKMIPPTEFILKLADGESNDPISYPLDDAASVSNQDLQSSQASDSDEGNILDTDLDIEGLEAQGRPALSQRNHKDSQCDIFASATAFADALEIDPYYGLDIMDFGRPSLQKKKRGKHRNPDLVLSDSELELELENAWRNDREKKKARKQKREELRSQGLLGRGANDPDLRSKYTNGMGFSDLKMEIRIFLLSSRTSLALPPMAKYRRKLIHDLANALSLNSQSRGKGSSRFPILHKNSRTPRHTQKTISFIDQLFSKGRFNHAATKSWDQKIAKSAKPPRGRPDSSVSYMDGDIVGASAPEIGAGNKGRAILERMGWSMGTALGATNNKGILLPVAHVVKNSKAGLG